ncbi:MAG: hypothetical protein HY593_03875 [Candidatus Omnitrophica bacterium]|nr:hypothetical protein [Candidatus Omnitrophota bacterium]
MFKLGLWEKALENYELLLTDDVVGEIQYYEDDEGKQRPIDLEPWMKKGNPKVVSVLPSQVSGFVDKFDRTYYERFDKGELTTLTRFYGSQEECLIVSTDSIVYKAIGRLKMGERGISLEELFKDIGFTKRLDWPFTEGYRRHYTDLGTQDFIRNFKARS